MQGWLRGLLLLFVLLPGLTLAQEAIEDFAVSLQVEADGNLLVTERINVRAEGRDIRRGIYRDLPVSYTLPMGLEQSSPITLLGVARDGLPESVRSERNGAWVRFYLGSPNILLEPGRYRYELRYRVGRALLHHADTDELYWNVTGNGWMFPIRQASVEVRLPAGRASVSWLLIPVHRAIRARTSRYSNGIMTTCAWPPPRRCRPITV